MVWIVGVTKPNQEAIAEQNLKRQSFEFYCPRYVKKLNNKSLVKPLFPRYIFILINKIWHQINSTRGMSYVLLGDNGPQTISEMTIDNIKAKERNGLVNFDPPPPKYKKGDKIRVIEGPLADTGQVLLYEGLSTHDRVKILMELLGRKVIIELPEQNISAA